MLEPIVYLNGEIVPLSQGKVSIFDLGLVQGAAVTEMIRTFRHQPFRLEAHLDRLFRSLRCVGFPLETTVDELRAVVEKVCAHNAALIPEAHDLGIVVFVTAGLNLTYLGAVGAAAAKVPTLCVHTFPLPFELWKEKYLTGQHLVTPSIRQVPPDSLDPKIKSRSRLHWYLADRQARLADPQAGALLLDHSGNVTETSTANFFIVAEGILRTPSEKTTLGGVSQQVVFELASQRGIESCRSDFQLYDVLTADEAFTSSTPYCLMPVTRVNGQAIGDGKPGPVFQELTAAWSELVGVDIIQQIETGAAERAGNAV